MPKEKRSKLDASGKKGMFMGYNETSKAYRIYVLGQREVEICHDVTFDEDAALKKVRNLPSSMEDKEEEEEEAGKQEELKDEPMPDVEGPMDPIDPPPSNKRKPSWLKDTLEDAERHIAPRGTFCESKKPNRYQGYLAAMSTIVQSEPGSFEEVVKHQVWTDDMHEEYESVMKNDVCDVVPRPKDKSVITSKWLYKIKHGADGSDEKYKEIFVSRGFSQKEGIDYDDIFSLFVHHTTM